jgi:predicted TIM-barrel fold metal-dependent hydrolase
MPRIINCHIHTFTVEHVPVDFLPLKLGVLFKIPYVRVPVRWLLGVLNPFDNRDQFSRFANFMKVAHGKSQKDLLRLAQGRYPADTRFVVLPMDMAFMGAGRVPKSIEEQHEELARLRDELGDVVIPFAAVDPRRKEVLSMLRSLVEQRGFRGIKVYPNLGYQPDDPVLMEHVWPYAVAKNLPVMTHCSRGGPRGEGISKEDLDGCTAPSRWVPVLEKFPTLWVCLAHLGGGEEWEHYFGDGWQPGVPNQRKSWLADILDLIRSGKYPNLYSDISYTVFRFDEYAPAIKVFLADPLLRERILFGSDYYMTENERFEERLLSMNLRALLGEDLFWQIADVNPRRYLGEQ